MQRALLHISGKMKGMKALKTEADVPQGVVDWFRQYTGVPTLQQANRFWFVYSTGLDQRGTGAKLTDADLQAAQTQPQCKYLRQGNVATSAESMFVCVVFRVLATGGAMLALMILIHYYTTTHSIDSRVPEDVP